MRSYTKSSLVRGWGINDADYNTHVQIRKGKYLVCPIYVKWSSMLNRVLNEDYHLLQPTYLDTLVSRSWKYFSAFKRWTDSQVAWAGMQLDKDILIIGNKEYSPEACCYVPQWLNTFMAPGGAYSELPMGVIYKKGSENATKVYYVQVCKVDKSNRYVGRFYTPKEAHRAYQLTKAEQIEKAVLKYMLEPCYRQDVANAIYLRAEILRDDYANNRETFSL